MTANTRRIIFISVLLILLFSFSYAIFSNYQPKVLKKVTEVKGLSNINTDDFPYPQDAVKIGANQTSISKQTTFSTQETLPNVIGFYKNTYLKDEWKIVNSSTADNTETISFKKSDQIINIMATKENDNTTIVSIEMTEMIEK